MIFHADKKDLDFELGGRRYVVPLGSEVDIPDHLAYCVESRGILLAQGPSPSGSRMQGVSVSAQAPIVATAVPHRVAEEALADLTGEDPGSAEVDDSDAVVRTMEQLERQGVTVPGKKPRRKG